MKSQSYLRVVETSPHEVENATTERRGPITRPTPVTLPMKPAASRRRSVPTQATEGQTKWLERGLSQPGGKLPLFDEHGQKVSARTVNSCVDKGWAKPWFANPMKPDWLICKITDKGRAIFDVE